jgi:integrase/recombinase XerD
MAKEKKAPVITDTQFRRIVAVVRSSGYAKRNMALLHVSFNLGLRAKEMASLLIRDVLTPSGELKDEVLLTKATTKGGKQRLVYLANKDVRRALTEYIKERTIHEDEQPHPEAPLFKSQKGGAFSPNTMQMLFKRMYVAAGMDGASSHSGRRTFATSLIERGVDIKAVSSLMGHSTVAMTAHYVEDNPIRLRKICEDVQAGVRV